MLLFHKSECGVNQNAEYTSHYSLLGYIVVCACACSGGETAEEAAVRGRRGAPIPSVRGDAHSLFQITGKYSQLLLSGLELNHMASAADKKDVGCVALHQTLNPKPQTLNPKP